MKSTISSAKKSKRGRPKVDTDAVNVRFPVKTLEMIDDWRRGQPDLPGRPEAIRRLVELGEKHGPRFVKVTVTASPLDSSKKSR